VIEIISNVFDAAVPAIMFETIGSRHVKKASIKLRLTEREKGE